MVESVYLSHALGSAPRRHSDDIGRVADGRDAERVIHAVQAQAFAQQRAVDRHRPQHRQRQRQRRARGKKSIECRIEQRDKA